MINTLKYIWNHPLNQEKKLRSIVNFTKWQVTSRLWGGDSCITG